MCHALGWPAVCIRIRMCIPYNIRYTVRPLIIESLRAKKRLSTVAPGALDDSLVVQTNILKSGSVPVDDT